MINLTKKPYVNLKKKPFVNLTKKALVTPITNPYFSKVSV